MNTQYLLRRLGASLITIWLAATLAFIALRAIPGDAVDATLASSGASQAQIALRRAELGLDQPLIAQYGQLLIGLLRGDLGRSLIAGRRVNDMIAEQFGATLSLAIAAMGIAILVGLLLGIIASRLPPWRWLANAMIALLLASPVYWTGTLIIYFFSVMLKLLPSAGDGDLRFLLLPSLALGLSLSGSIAQVTSGSLGQTAHADFIRTARAKGLKERIILYRHTLRASLSPIIAVIALQVGFLLGGTAVTEALFVRQGIGQLLINSINARDYPVVQGMVILGAITYSIVHFMADVLIAAFDPRLQAEQ